MAKQKSRFKVGDKVRYHAEGRTDIASIEGKVIDVLDTGCWIQPLKHNRPMFFQHSELKLLSAKPSQNKRSHCKPCAGESIQGLFKTMDEAIRLCRRLKRLLKPKAKS